MSRRLLLPLLTILALASACTNNSEAVVVVTVTGRPATRPFRELEITVKNAGAEVTKTFPLGESQPLPLSFSITPGARSGELTISARAKNLDTSIVALGERTISLSGDTVDADLVLEPADFVVNQQTADDQFIVFDPLQFGRQLAAAPDGSFIATFENSCPLTRCDILARRFAATTLPARNGTSEQDGDFIINTLDEYTESPAIAASSGGYMVAWLASPTDMNGLKQTKATFLDLQGAHVIGSVAVSTGPEPHTAPNVLARADGTFVVVWSRARPAPDSGSDIRMRRFGFNGQALAAEQIVSNATAGAMTLPHGVGLPGGGFAIVWQHSEGALSQVRARLFDAAGAAIGNDILVSTTTSGAVFAPRALAQSDGFLVGWQWFDATDPAGKLGPLRLRRFDLAGVALAGESDLVAETSYQRAAPVFALGADDAFAAAWTDCPPFGDLVDSCGIRFLRLAADGTPIGTPASINTITTTDQDSPSIIRLGDGFLIAWTDRSSTVPDENGTAVRARVVY